MQNYTTGSHSQHQRHIGDDAGKRNSNKTATSSSDSNSDTSASTNDDSNANRPLLLSEDDRKLLSFLKDQHQRNTKNLLGIHRRYSASTSSASSSPTESNSVSPSASSSSLSPYNASPISSPAGRLVTPDTRLNSNTATSIQSASATTTTGADDNASSDTSLNLSSSSTNLSTTGNKINSTTTYFNQSNNTEINDQLTDTDSESEARPKTARRKDSLGFQLRALNETSSPIRLFNHISTTRTTPTTTTIASSSTCSPLIVASSSTDTRTNTNNQLDSNYWNSEILPANVSISSLSSELVSETLNYFVNCGQRVSQMTKTYDDNDAYILLLQEKEVDLELAARIGQDLLKQNKQLREFNDTLETQLSKHQEAIQQLKHELASKVSLLDTFIEEEEHQTSLAESLDDSTSNSNLCNHKQQSQISSSSNKHSGNDQPHSTYTPTVANKSSKSGDLHREHVTDYDDDEDDDDGTYRAEYGFSSLNNAFHQRPTCSSVEPFSSLPPSVKLNKPTGTGHNEPSGVLFKRNNSSTSCSYDDLITQVGPGVSAVASSSQNNDKSLHQELQQQAFESVTLRLVESNKRLCELQDELIYKCEQNLTQQEKIHQLQQQLSELDRQLGDVSLENETLHKSIQQSSEIQKELHEELKICKRNFSELLSVFLESQRVYRAERSRFEEEAASLANGHRSTDFGRNQYDSMYFDEELNLLNEPADISFNSYATNHFNNYTKEISLDKELGQLNFNNNKRISTIAETETCCTFLEVGSETGIDTDAEHRQSTELTSPETSPEPNSGCDKLCRPVILTAVAKDSDNRNNGGKWVGLSSYMITSILILFLSVTITSTTNLNLAHRLQLKLDK